VHSAETNTSLGTSESKNSGKSTESSTTPTARIVEVNEAWCIESIDKALTTHYDTVVKIYNSSATNHMTPYRHMLSNFHNTNKRTVNAAGKTSFLTYGIGNMKVTMPHGRSDGSTVTYTLKDVLYIDQILYLRSPLVCIYLLTPRIELPTCI
jgi:hypothetical protein